MRNALWCILTLLILTYSCKKDSDDYVAPDIGHGYAGLAVGKYVIYDVDSLFYDDNNVTIDTTIFQIKEVVDSKYIDLEGEEAFKIARYRKDSTQWVLIDIWNSKITQTNFQKDEENVRFVKLIFPVREGNTWNGNAMNNLSNWQYEYTTVDLPESIGGNPLSNVLTVIQYEDLNLITQELFQEKYAKGVGMVYKKSMDLTRGNLSAPWGGYDVTMTLSSYGG